MTNEQKLNYFRKALPERQQLMAHEMEEFRREKSSWNLPRDGMDYLERAVDIRRAEVFTTMSTVSAMAVHSNLNPSEL